MTNILFHAIRNFDVDGVKHLIDDGSIDVDDTEYQGMTPLMLSCAMGYLEFIPILLEAGADIDKTDDRGVNALMVAVISKDIRTVQILLDAGANIEIKNNINETAIDIARNMQEKEILELLEQTLEDRKNNNGNENGKNTELKQNKTRSNLRKYVKNRKNFRS